MLSIICVYNNESTLNDWLIHSLKDQTARYELILLDNSDGKFTSAASALNSGGKKAGGDYLCFVHQDIHFCRKTDLENIEKQLSALDNPGIVGVAGMSSEGNTFGQCQRNWIVEHENPPAIWGHFTGKPESVQTVDECFFIIPKTIFKTHPFDEKTCDHWHFYSADYCLTLGSAGYKVYTIPFPVHHQSSGFSRKFRINRKSCGFMKDYYRSLANVLKKHKKNYRKVFTTSGIYRTDIHPLIQDLGRIRILISRYVIR